MSHTLFYVDGMMIQVISATLYAVRWLASDKWVFCNAGDSAGNGGYTRITFGIGHVTIRKAKNREVSVVKVTPAIDSHGKYYKFAVSNERYKEVSGYAVINSSVEFRNVFGDGTSYDMRPCYYDKRTKQHWLIG